MSPPSPLGVVILGLKSAGLGPGRRRAGRLQHRELPHRRPGAAQPPRRALLQGSAFAVFCSFERWQF